MQPLRRAGRVRGVRSLVVVSTKMVTFCFVKEEEEEKEEKN